MHNEQRHELKYCYSDKIWDIYGREAHGKQCMEQKFIQGLGGETWKNDTAWKTLA
jgi:hypothetical protein